METKIKSRDVLFKDFHHEASEIFYIPSLQRPYTWEAKKQVDRLWDDVVENKSPYYIGSIVSIMGDGSISKDQIIDGQQRLATIYLMLVAIRDFAVTLKDKEARDIALEVDDYLNKYRGDGKEIRLSFTNERSNLIYKAIVNNEKLDLYKTEIQKRFIKNFEHIKSRVSEYCGKGKYKLERIVDILDRIKNLQLIFIRCQDKSAAFKLFESINATGVDLTTNDLIKNSIFESMYEDKKSFDFVELGWKEMTEEFNENSTELKTYIRHHWISTVDYTSHSKLFDDFMEEYKDKDDILKYAKSLFNLAPVYNSIRKGEVELLDKLNRNRNDLNEIKEILKFMSSLGVDQIYSVLLNIYNNEPGKFKKDLIRLSAFQFIFKYIPGSPSLPEKKFANFCSGKLDRSSLMNDLVVICRNKEADFVGKLVEKIKYTGGNSIDIQFILEKYLYFLGKPSKFSNPTIEHIIPQDKNDPIFNAFKIDEKKIIRKINCLGNLTILEKSENSSEKMFNQVFSKKYPLYGKNIFSGNKKIIKYKFDENPERAIDKRANEVASLIYKIFFKALETGK